MVIITSNRHSCIGSNYVFFLEQSLYLTEKGNL